MSTCTLCQLGDKAIARNEYWTLALNENQATLGRVFFALNRHETDVTALTQTEQLSLWEFVTQVKGILSTHLSPDHFNYMFLMNVDPHAHFHIFPRYAAPRELAGHTFTDDHYGGHYDPAEYRPMDTSVRAELTKILQSALSP